jgi:magnesium chelatase subunit I
VGQIFQKYASASDFAPVLKWFEEGAWLRLPETASSKDAVESLSRIPGLLSRASLLNVDERSSPAERVAACEFLLEGLAATKRISRNQERGYGRSEERSRPEIGYEEVDSGKGHLN